MQSSTQSCGRKKHVTQHPLFGLAGMGLKAVNFSRISAVAEALVAYAKSDDVALVSGRMNQSRSQ